MTARRRSRRPSDDLGPAHDRRAAGAGRVRRDHRAPAATSATWRASSPGSTERSATRSPRPAAERPDGPARPADRQTLPARAGVGHRHGDGRLRVDFGGVTLVDPQPPTASPGRRRSRRRAASSARCSTSRPGRARADLPQPARRGRQKPRHQRQRAPHRRRRSSTRPARPPPRSTSSRRRRRSQTGSGASAQTTSRRRSRACAAARPTSGTRGSSRRSGLRRRRPRPRRRPRSRCRRGRRTAARASPASRSTRR